MSYESPIKLITDINYKLIEDQERNIVKAVCSYGIDISKDELFKLLFDDRKQYDKGFSDGRFDRDREIVQCKDCKHYGTPFGKTHCSFIDWTMKPDDFCSRGERRKNEQTDNT